VGSWGGGEDGGVFEAPPVKSTEGPQSPRIPPTRLTLELWDSDPLDLSGVSQGPVISFLRLEGHIFSKVFQ
jgi:hypothetical protein